MGQPLRFARFSSARRSRHRPGTGPVVLLLLVLLLVVVATVEWQERAERPANIMPTPAPPTQVVPPARPSPSPTATPELPVLQWQPVPSPSPTAPLFVAARPSPIERRRPTPGLESCVQLSWNAAASSGAVGQVLVDVEVRNRCQRVLEPMQVWLWIGGYRDGALVQSTRGRLYDPVRPGGFQHALIALPGSATWYDQIEVRLARPDEH